jgi:hypothetical protein
MKCEQCGQKIKDIIPDIEISSWHKLMNYFEHELDEDEITNKTYDSMTSALLFLRPETTEDS